MCHYHLLLHKLQRKMQIFIDWAIRYCFSILSAVAWSLHFNLKNGIKQLQLIYFNELGTLYNRDMQHVICKITQGRQFQNVIIPTCLAVKKSVTSG